jgi:hypothetical protein
MRINHEKLLQAVRVLALAGAWGSVLGIAVFAAAASSPNPDRDVLMSGPSDVDGLVLAASGAATGERRSESFVSRTNVVEYPFQLDRETDVVRLNLSVEIEHGLVRWELIDPSGAVRSNIRTTERARMDDTELAGMQGKWVLRMKFEDATGRYEIDWSR